jgi:hypothetical protein
MSLPHESPRDALNGLIAAYCSLDLEEIVRNKDFDFDSRFFWEDLGLPVTPEQLAKSRIAFETNFRNELNKEMPDYRHVKFRVVSEERVQDNFVVIHLTGTTLEKQTFELHIPTFKTDDGWKVVLHPRFDHL